MLLRISIYDMKVMYIKGKEIKIAVCLSCLIKHSKDSEIEGLNLVMHDIRHMVSHQKKTLIATATSNDTTMLKLIEYILHGWPLHSTDYKNSMEQYFNHRDELSVYSGLVVKGSHVIIPTELIQEILQCLHKAHQGTSKTLERTKIVYFGLKLKRT